MARTLPAAVITAKDAVGNIPDILVQIHFPGGTRYLSDRNLTADGQAYEGLISKVNSIQYDNKTFLHKMNIELVNLDTTSFTNEFLSDPPETTPVDVFLRFAEAPDVAANFVPLFMGEIYGVNYGFNKARIELIESGEKVPRFPGIQVTTQNLPSADKNDIGNILPIVYGEVFNSRAVLAVKQPETILSGTAGPTDTIFNVVDTSLFPISGSGKINNEIFTYTNKNATQFLGITRGEVVEHQAGSQIRGVGEEVYVFAGHVSKSVLNVRAGGGPVVTPFVTSIADGGVIAGQSFTTARFVDRPQGVVPGFGNAKVRIDWDTVGAENTSTDPEKAFRNSGSFTALNHATVDGLTAGTRLLSLERATPVADLGTLNFAELVCRFFTQSRVIAANGLRANIKNTALASIQNLDSELGDATTPEANTVDVGGNINIDHGHATRLQTVQIFPERVFSSNEWGAPQNAFDPSLTLFAISDPVLVTDPPKFQEMKLGLPSVANGSGEITRFRVCGHSNGSKGFRVRLNNAGTFVGIFATIGDGFTGNFCGPWSTVPGVTFTSIANPASHLSIVAGPTTAPSFTRSFCGFAWLEVEYDTRPVDLSGEAPVLDTTPVYELRATINQADLPDGFDSLTDLRFNIGYGAGTTPRPEIYIFESFIELDISGSTGTVDSTEVTADIKGHVDDGGGTFTGTPLALIHQASDVIRHYVQFYGNLTASDMDLTSFASAKAALSSLSAFFVLNGVIREDVNFMSQAKVLATNCRCDFIWEDGKARLNFRQTGPTTPTEHTFNKDNFFGQLEVSRVPMSELINDLSVKYDLAQDGSGGYNKTEDAEEPASIAQFRRRTRQIELDFVNTFIPANLIEQYYRLRRKFPKRLITVRSPLNALHLQRGDLVAVTEPRLDLNNTIFRIEGVEYVPGKSTDQVIDSIIFKLEEQ